MQRAALLVLFAALTFFSLWNQDRPFGNGDEVIYAQGVREMDDSAMIMRVKYKTKPGDQFVIRKEVYHLMQEAFREYGIEFAHRNVTVYMPPEPGSEAGTEAAGEDQQKDAKADSEAQRQAAAAAALSAVQAEEEAEKAKKKPKK